MNTKILGILAIIIIISFFVWPTMYKYDHIKLGDGTYPNRVNRFSGNTEVLVASGWKEMGNNYSSSKEQELPTNEKKKIDGRGQFKDIFGREQYIGEIYNGTTWTLTKVRLF
jgi:hypothetical protein